MPPLRFWTESGDLNIYLHYLNEGFPRDVVVVPVAEGGLGDEFARSPHGRDEYAITS